jgi:hypothetical protein
MSWNNTALTALACVADMRAVYVVRVCMHNGRVHRPIEEITDE